MSENKITIAIPKNQTKKSIPPTIDGMVALKKIENYSYALTDEIGLGYSSHVYKGKNDISNEIVAIKVIDLKKEDELHKQFLNDEISVLEKIKKTNSESLLRLFDVFKTKNNLYIITEYCEGKDVAKILRKKKKLSDSQTQSIMKQLLQAYSELFELGIVHRDLKLANIFIKKGKIKLADFGFAIEKQNCETKFDYNVGSPYYMPPQTLKFNRYSPKSDIWALGVIAYELLYGKLPWKEKVEQVQFETISSNKIEDLLSEEVGSQNTRQFITKCMQIDFDKRLTPQQAIDYDWKNTSDYIEGFAEIDRIFQPQSAAIIKSGAPMTTKHTKITHDFTTNEVKNESIQQILRKRDQSIPKKQPQFRRQNSNIQPIFINRQRQRQISHPNKHYNVEKPIISEQKVDFFRDPFDNYNSFETTILGQIHYCRFMAAIHHMLEEHESEPQSVFVRTEISNKVVNIMEMLRLVAEKQSHKIQNYLSNPSNFARWTKLKQVISQYHQKFSDMFKKSFQNHDAFSETLSRLLRRLASNMGSNLVITEELSYFYQLNLLQKKENFYRFAIYSKIEMLANRKPCREDGTSQRLNNKLTHLGIV